MTDTRDRCSVSSDELHISPDDFLFGRLTPDPYSNPDTPGPEYRGPVTTPGPEYRGPVTTPAFLDRTFSGFPDSLTNNQTWPHTAGRRQIKTKFQQNTNKRYKATKSTNTILGFPSSKETFSPRWLANLTSQPDNELHKQYVKRRYNTDFRERCFWKQPTPGEQALLDGWARNTHSSGSLRNKVSSDSVDNIDRMTLQSFPPSRVLISRSKTADVDNFTCYEQANNSDNPFSKHHRAETSDGGLAFGQHSSRYFANHGAVNRKTKNYLRFMAKTQRPTASYKPKSELPAIFVGPTVLSVLKHTSKGKKSLEEHPYKSTEQKVRGNNFYQPRESPSKAGHVREDKFIPKRFSLTVP